VLFIDARKLGRMNTRVTRVFEDGDVQRIAGTVHRWR
jgi:type I restriction enzyme M protein